MKRFAFVLAWLAAFALPAYAQGNFADWGAIVVAGDYHAHDGSPSEIFDNARRDVTADLLRMGFKPQNIIQFSQRPTRYPERPLMGDAQTIANSLWDLSNRTSAGCFIYMTSHGEPDGMILDNGVLDPDKLNDMVSNACGGRPTVVVISACFSGVFVPVLKGADRMVMTAARPDRTSFGCGSGVREPYFDDCFVHEVPATHDLPDLAGLTRACVAQMEKKTGASPPSEPQISIGAQVAQELPGWSFAPPTRAASAVSTAASSRP
ncbi:MAG TPA: C13 family peptidase [Rhizomicrobium sp.]|nr:C13 family peptidase [Rhizomicrobium sp.]